MTISWLTMCRTAVKALMRNRMRTLLSILSVSVGVFCITIVMALGKGVQAYYEMVFFGRLGTGFVSIRYSEVSGKKSVDAGETNLTLKDYEAIEEGILGLEAISPGFENSAQIIFREYNWETYVIGCSSDYSSIVNWKVARGRFIAEDDVCECLNVCVLGDTVVEALFPDMDPIGEIVRINQTPMLVVGVLSPKGQGSVNDRVNDLVLIPYTTAMHRLFHRHSLDYISCKVAYGKNTKDCGEQIARLLRLRHRISEDDEDDFWINTHARIEQIIDRLSNSFDKLFCGLASVSLVVSGIGIMNIMLVSVTERVREIGIRMALGAKRRDILLQFLVESIIMSLAGGVLGVVLSFLIVFMGTMDVLLGIFMETEITTSFSYMSWNIVALSFCFSVAMGVIFGFCPALQASKLEPIQALRHE